MYTETDQILRYSRWINMKHRNIEGYNNHEIEEWYKKNVTIETRGKMKGET